MLVCLSVCVCIYVLICLCNIYLFIYLFIVVLCNNYFMYLIICLVWVSLGYVCLLYKEKAFCFSSGLALCHCSPVCSQSSADSILPLCFVPVRKAACSYGNTGFDQFTARRARRVYSTSSQVQLQKLAQNTGSQCPRDGTFWRTRALLIRNQLLHVHIRELRNQRPKPKCGQDWSMFQQSFGRARKEADLQGKSAIDATLFDAE